MKNTMIDVIFIIATCIFAVVGIYLAMTIDMQCVAVLSLMAILGWLALDDDLLVNLLNKLFGKEDGLD